VGGVYWGSAGAESYDGVGSAVEVQDVV
jgi:hypothetical protein